MRCCRVLREAEMVSGANGNYWQWKLLAGGDNKQISETKGTLQHGIMEYWG